MTTTPERLNSLETHGVTRPSAAELSQCVQAIASEPPEVLARLGFDSASMRVDAVVEAWSLARDAEVWHYVDFVDPSTVPPGRIYTTWVVVISHAGGGSVRVSYFRSRVREDGRGVDTIPP